MRDPGLWRPRIDSLKQKLHPMPHIIEIKGVDDQGWYNHYHKNEAKNKADDETHFTRQMNHKMKRRRNFDHIFNLWQKNTIEKNLFYSMWYPIPDWKAQPLRR